MSHIGSLKSLSEHLGCILHADLSAANQTPAANELAKLLDRHGAVVFRSFVDSPEAFVRFSNQYGRDFSTYQGGWFAAAGNVNRSTHAGEPTLFSATGNTQEFALPLHGELYYQKTRPALLWFYCQVPPATLGQTTLCDGRALWQKLSPSSRDIFETRRLKYVNHLNPEVWKRIFHTCDLQVVKSHCVQNDMHLTVDPETESITVEYVCPAAIMNSKGERAFINSLMIIWRGERLRKWKKAHPGSQGTRAEFATTVRWEDGSEISAELLTEIGAAAKLLTAEVSWERGDVLLVDNRRVLHGRRDSPESAQRIILVRLSEPAF